MAKNNHRLALRSACTEERSDEVTRGFTLIELMIALAIVGILASLGAISFQTSLKRARDAQRKADLLQIRGVLETWRADQPTSVYPTGNGPNYQINGCSGPCTWGSQWSYGGSVYMQKLPQDSRGVTYNYRYFSGGSTYFLEACLENSGEQITDNVIAVTSTQTGWTSSSCTSSKLYQVTNP